MAHVVSITITPKGIERRPADRFGRVSVDRATLVANRGIAGDLHAKPGKRQLNVMFAETVAQLRDEGFRTAPGELGEQLVLAGIDENAQAPGARLRLGESAVIELVMLRTGCERFSSIQGLPAKAAKSRIGYMARVIAGGEIAAGSTVDMVAAPAASGGAK